MYMQQSRDTQKESWMISDIFKLMLETAGGSPAVMTVLLLSYAAAETLINVLWNANAGIAAILRLIISVAVMLSLVSVMRSAFENGKPRLKSVIPPAGLVGKVCLAAALAVLLFAAAALFFQFISIFARYFFISVFGRLFTPKSIYFFVGVLIFMSISFTAYASFCLIAFAGKNSFGESLSLSSQILTENKLLFFCLFSLLSAAIVFLISSYALPLFQFGKGGFGLASASKIASVKTLLAARFNLIASVLGPLYWFFMTAVYFTLGHEGHTKKVMRQQQYVGKDYTDEFSRADQQPQTGSDEDFGGFSLTNAFYFSWGVYKRIFRRLTAGILGVYAVFAVTGGSAVLILRHAGLISTSFSAKNAALKEIFFLSAGAFVFYCLLMFFFSSFAAGFFRGKGISFKNFFPGTAAVSRFMLFLAFIAVFISSVPFIVGKINFLLQASVKSLSFPVSSAAAVFSALFAVIIVYALVSLFYAPFFILDGHKFADALTASSEMMKGQRIAFLCVLCGLLLLNLIGHFFVIGWIFTVPFSVVVLVQIYITLSAAADGGGGEDVADY